MSGGGLPRWGVERTRVHGVERGRDNRWGEKVTRLVGNVRIVKTGWAWNKARDEERAAGEANDPGEELFKTEDKFQDPEPRRAQRRDGDRQVLWSLLEMLLSVTRPSPIDLHENYLGFPYYLKISCSCEGELYADTDSWWPVRR